MRHLLKIPPAALLLAAGAGFAGALALALSPADQENATRAPERVHNMPRLSFECSTDEECAATPPCALKPGCDGGPNSKPFALVGYGCAGATEPLYRDERRELQLSLRYAPRHEGERDQRAWIAEAMKCA